MKYTLYGLVVESDWHFSYFSIYCGKRTPDVTVVVKLADQEHIPSVFKFGLNWFDLSIPGVIEYTYKQSVLEIFAVNALAIQATISTIPFFLAVANNGGVLFHCSCILNLASQKATLLSASSGTGKTTVSSFLTRTHPEKYVLLCDDACALYRSANKTIAFAGSNFSKISPAAAELIKIETAGVPYVGGKYIFSNYDQYYYNDIISYEVDRIIFMANSDDDAASIAKMDIRTLSAYAYNATIGTQYVSSEVKACLKKRVLSVLEGIPALFLRYSHFYDSLKAIDGLSLF